MATTAYARVPMETTLAAAMESFTTEEAARAMETSPEPQVLATHFHGRVRLCAIADECHTIQAPIFAVPTDFTARLMVHIPVAAAVPPTTTGPRCVAVVSLDPDPMVLTLDAAAEPPTTTGPKCVVAAL